MHGPGGDVGRLVRCPVPADHGRGEERRGADRVSAASVPVGRPVLVEMGVNEIRPTTETDGDAESTTDGTVAVVSRGPVPGRVIPTAVVATLPAPVATPATTEAAGSPSARIDGHAVSLAERLRQLDDALTEGVLTMQTTLLGVVQVDPRELLEEGIRTELVRQLTHALQSGLAFKAGKAAKKVA